MEYEIFVLSLLKNALQHLAVYLSVFSIQGHMIIG